MTKGMVLVYLIWLFVHRAGGSLVVGYSRVRRVGAGMDGWWDFPRRVIKFTSGNKVHTAKCEREGGNGDRRVAARLVTSRQGREVGNRGQWLGQCRD